LFAALVLNELVALRAKVNVALLDAAEITLFSGLEPPIRGHYDVWSLNRNYGSFWGFLEYGCYLTGFFFSFG
jgi:hypothetical protein